MKNFFAFLIFSSFLIVSCGKKEESIDLHIKGSVISYQREPGPDGSWADVAYLTTIRNNTKRDFIISRNQQDLGKFALSGLNEGEFFSLKIGAPFRVIMVKPGDSLNILLYGRGAYNGDKFNLEDYEKEVASENKLLQFYFYPSPEIQSFNFQIIKDPVFRNENCLFENRAGAYPPCLMKYWKK